MKPLLLPTDTEVFAAIKEAAKMPGFQFNVDADDLAQELWLLYDEKLRHAYDPSRPLRPYLAECARRIGLSMTHRRAFEYAESDIKSSDDGESLFDSLPAKGSSLEESADRAVALGLLSQFFKGDDDMNTVLGLGRFADESRIKLPSPQPTKPASSGVSKPKTARKKKVLSEDQVELRSIRTEMKMTLNEFAVRIGITEASQRAYEYGQTRGVPAKVMKRARALRENNGVWLEHREALKARPIAETLAEWASILGVENDPAAISGALNEAVTANTLRRWLREIHEPTLGLLHELDDLVRMGPNARLKARLVRLLKAISTGSSAAAKGFVLIYLAPIQDLQKLVQELLDQGEGKDSLDIQEMAPKLRGLTSAYQIVTQGDDDFLLAPQGEINAILKAVELLIPR